MAQMTSRERVLTAHEANLAPYFSHHNSRFTIHDSGALPTGLLRLACEW
ncbi:MAG: hypothetical protein J7M39_05860 [Anaerolineae bacterium]|nr:hypothetical protein [Anaerolineae bacterium]